jgi:hypothetical protein
MAMQVGFRVTVGSSGRDPLCSWRARRAAA